MPDPHPPHLADAMARFRAAADAAVDRGRRVAGDARAAGAAFQRESDEMVARLRSGELRSEAQPTAPDLRAAATEYRTEQGLPVPEVPEPGEVAPPPPTARPRRQDPPEDEDFSQFRVMHPL